MSNIRDPQYGVKKDKDTLTTQDPAAVLYGVTSDNKFIPIKVNDDGSLAVGTSVTLEAGDLEIGAVEIKNYDTDDRAFVSPNHEVLAQARLYDAAGNALTSTSGSLDVDISNATLAVTQSGIWNLNNISGTISLPTGAATETTLSAINSKLDVSLSTRASEATLSGFRTDFNAVDFATQTTLAAVKGDTAKLDVNLSTRSSEATLSGFRTDFNAVDFSTETTLLAVKTDLDKFTFLAGSVNSNITNATLAVTQSGAWSTGRTWTLASGTDSVSAIQSGTWDINNITGTVSLPTGAATEATLATRATEATLSGFRTDFNAVDFATQTTLAAVKTDVDNLDVLLSTRASETTLLAVKTDLDKFTFTGNDVNSHITNPTLAVTQSGSWTVSLAMESIEIGTVDQGTPNTLANAWPVSFTDGSFVLGTAAHPVRIDPTGTTTQPVSIASLPLPTGASTAANQTNGSQKTQIVDGSGNVIGSTGNALDVNIKSPTPVSTNPTSDATREIGLVSSSDTLIVSETFSTSVNTYATARPVNGDMVVRHYPIKKIFVKNTSAFNGRLTILGSIDNGANFDVTVAPDAALNAGITSVTDLNDALTHIQIQVRSQNNGQTTTYVSKAYAMGA